MARNRSPARAACTLGAALLILSGCDRFSTQSDTEFARAALERNPDLTIVASDKDANTFTVQVKGSSELRVVRASEVIGALPSTGVASAAGESAEAAKSSSVAEAAPSPETTERAQEGATAGEPARAAGQVASAQPGSGAKAGTGFVTDAAGNTRTFDGAEAQAGADTSASSSQSAATTASGAAAEKGTTADKPGAPGKVLAAGPGYSVTAGEPRANRPIHLAEATELKSPSNSVLEKRYDPMICQGNRLIQINGRNIEFEGDGLSALDGCELHITNSHIIAHGLGLSVRAANVHIQNSIIEGEGGSVSASQGSKVYSQQSTFKGLSRRLDTATFEDLGGTSWD